jgi:hypothetical protein
MRTGSCSVSSPTKTGQGCNLPGQRVFTCLSQDIIAHEVTHAIIDGIRTNFTEPTNPDVLAFHEGFADLCALFAHFSHKEALTDAFRRTGGRLYQTDLAPVARPISCNLTLCAIAAATCIMAFDLLELHGRDLRAGPSRIHAEIDP